MQNWFPRSRGAHHGRAPGVPPSGPFDARFESARVLLDGQEFINIDWREGGRFQFWSGLCDQLILGEVSHDRPGVLALRFRPRSTGDPTLGESDMVLARIGLRGANDVHTAQMLCQVLLERYPWLRKGFVQEGVPEAPVDSIPESETYASPADDTDDEAPAPEKEPEEWVSFTPGLRTRELHEDVRVRRAEADLR